MWGSIPSQGSYSTIWQAVSHIMQPMPRAGTLAHGAGPHPAIHILPYCAGLCGSGREDEKSAAQRSLLIARGE